MARVFFVFRRIPTILSLVVHFVLLKVSLVDIVGSHTQHLPQGNEKMEEIYDLDLGILFIEFLLLSKDNTGLYRNCT